MTFINVKLDAKESKVAPEGRFPLRAVKVEERKTGAKSKHPGELYCMVMLANDEPDAGYSPVFYNLMFPQSHYEDNINQMRKLDIQRFLHQFNIPGSSDGFDTDDIVGSQADVLLTLGEDDKGNPRNEVKLDRLPSDGEEEEEKPRRRGRRGRETSADEEIPF